MSVNGDLKASLLLEDFNQQLADAEVGLPGAVDRAALRRRVPRDRVVALVLDLVAAILDQSKHKKPVRRRGGKK